MRMSLNRALIVIPLILAVACGRDADQFAEDESGLDRELELALRGDTVPATFEDTALTPPVRDAVAPEPPPRPTPTRRAATPPPPEPEPVVVPAPPVAAPEPVTVTRNVPIGTTMQLSLNETLSTRSNAVGDAFTATLTSHVTDGDGSVLIPAGAILRGRVTQVQKSGRVGETAVLSLAFEAVSFDGESYPLEASVISANPERVSRESTGEQVGKVAAGAAAGAILGRVLGGNTKSTVKGAVIGAAAGTAIAMGTADVDAVLKEGSLMVIRTDAPITIVSIVT